MGIRQCLTQSTLLLAHGDNGFWLVTILEMMPRCCCIMKAMLVLSLHPMWLQGDSGFMLVRSGTVVYRSPILQHFFDCPLQFGAAPDFSESTDNAEDAAVAELQVQPGDVLLAGSDGLWDNCFDSEILQMLPNRAEGAEQVTFRATVCRDHSAPIEILSAVHCASPQCSRPVCAPYWTVTVGHGRSCRSNCADTQHNSEILQLPADHAEGAEEFIGLSSDQRSAFVAAFLCPR